MAAGAGIVVYHIPCTRSERVVWLLEEIGIRYVARHLSYRGGDLRKPDFLAINPFGMVPTIVVDGIPVRETGAIFEFILRRYENRLVLEPGNEGYATFLAWLHSTEATIFQPIAAYIMNTEVLPEPERIPEFARRSLGIWLKYLRIIEESLAGREYLCGGVFSAADILLGHSLRMALEASMVPREFSVVHGYFARLSERPSFQRMLAA